MIGDDASGFLGINLTKPVYDGGRSEARIALLKSKRLQAETEEKKVYKEVVPSTLILCKRTKVQLKSKRAY